MPSDKLPSPRTFNRVCAAAALGWMVLTVGAAQVFAPDTSQFDALYRAASIAKNGQWHSLYAQPDAARSHGLEAHVTSNHGLEARATSFIAPPHVAVAALPLAWLNYHTAQWIWLGLSLLAAWWAILAAGRILELLDGRPTRLSGILVLVLAISPLVHHCVRMGNLSCVVAMFLAIAIVALLKNRSSRTGLAAALASAGSAVAWVFAPLLLVLRRWHAIAAGLLVTAIAAASLLVTGVGPWRQWAMDALPNLASKPAAANQSVHGLTQRIGGWTGRLAPGTVADIKALSGLLLAAIVIAMLRRRAAIAHSAPRTCAAVLTLLAWCTLAATSFPEHYYIFFVPMWGYLAWEARQSRVRAVLAALAALLTFAPLCVTPGVHLPEPLNSHMLMGALIMFGLGLTRTLAKGEPSQHQPAAVVEPASVSQET